MNLANVIRRKVFWLRHKSMYHSYLEISRINNTYDDTAKKQIANQLQHLLEHASKTTEYYRNMGDCIDNYEIINKETVINHRKEMLSSEYKGQKLHEMRTSGSTGIPFTMQQDLGMRSRVIAEIKAMNDWAGYPSHEKMLYIVGASKDFKFSKWQQWKENIYRIGVSINDRATMKKVVDFLIKQKPVALHASASNIPPIIEYIKDNKIPSARFSIKTVITGGEMVPEKLCDDIRKTFGQECTIAIKYSNEEMGIMAQKINDNYRINVADYYIEIFKLDSDNPCADGELGRIIVTDLYNFAIPLIRYDTGDIGAINKNPFPNITQLSGKRRDLIYDTKGNSISGATITNILKYMKHVKMWQLVQKSQKEYLYKIVPISETTTPTNEDILLPNLYQLLGNDAEIQVELVAEIPTIQSGKRRYTVNLYKPQ